MMKTESSSTPSIITGFLILFFTYHLPELFQRMYAEPLIWLLESGMALFIIISWLVAKKQKAGMQAYGLSHLKKRWPQLITGLVFGIAFFSLAVLLSVWFGWNQIQLKISLTGLIFPLFLFAAGTLLPSLAEDILTRGYVYAHWPKSFNNKWLVIFSALLFVANHIFKLNRPDVLLYLFILGIWLAWCLVYTRSLWLTLGVHWGSNFAYQFSANLLEIKTLRETGMENLLLAGCYVLGFLLMWVFRSRWPLVVDRWPLIVGR